jgi:hypothetical protein
MSTGIPKILSVAEGGTGAKTASAARASLDAASLASDNAFTGDNTFVISGSDKRFRLANGLELNIDIQVSSPKFVLNSIGGDYGIDIQNGDFVGLWNGFQALKKTDITTTPYTINYVANGVHIYVSKYSQTGTSAITLPSGLGIGDGTIVKIIDGDGNAASNNITVNRGGTDTILGQTSYTINSNYGAVAFIYDADTTNWLILP